MHYTCNNLLYIPKLPVCVCVCRYLLYKLLHLSVVYLSLLIICISVYLFHELYVLANLFVLDLLSFCFALFYILVQSFSFCNVLKQYHEQTIEIIDFSHPYGSNYHAVVASLYVQTIPLFLIIV